MQFLTDTDKIDVDIHDITMKIDNIMHEKITDKTGITVAHYDIQSFVVGIIHDNNDKQRKIRQARKELKNDIKEFDKIYRDKKAHGKVVKDLNTIKNKIKFYIFGYILIRD